MMRLARIKLLPLALLVDFVTICNLGTLSRTRRLFQEDREEKEFVQLMHQLMDVMDIMIEAEYAHRMNRIRNADMERTITIKLKANSEYVTDGCMDYHIAELVSKIKDHADAVVLNDNFRKVKVNPTVEEDINLQVHISVT